MNTKFFKCTVTFIISVAAASQLIATAGAEEAVGAGGGGIGATITAEQSSSSGTTTSVGAQITGFKIGMGKKDPNSGYANESYPTHAVMGTLRYNTLGMNGEKFTTGLEGSVHLFVGGTLLDRNASGCDIYGGVGASLSAAAVTRRGDSRATGTISPETGLLCQGYGAMLMISPTIGAMGAIAGNLASGETSADTTGRNFLAAGGRARLAIQDRAMFVAEVMTTPKIADGVTSKVTDAKVEGLFKVNDNFLIGGYAKGTEIKDCDRAADYRHAEGGITALRAF